jgi:hypothetical protein
MSVNERRKQQGRIEVAEKEVAGLASRVPQLTIVVPPDLPADAVVTRNGERVLGPMLNRQLPVDPGAHEVVLEAPGFERQVFSEQLGEGERREVRIAPLAAAGGGGGSGITRTWAYVAGGVGIAGLLVGGIAGGVTIGHKGTIDDNCVDVNCNADGIDAADAASTTGAISTVGFIVGGIGIAAGVTFWFLADDEPASDLAAARRAPAVGLRSASSPDGRGGWLGLEGRW